MIEFLTLVRASWLSGIPLSELIEPCETEMFRTLAIHYYGEMDMKLWRAKCP